MKILVEENSFTILRKVKIIRCNGKVKRTKDTVRHHSLTSRAHNLLVFCEVKRLRVVRSGVFVNYYMCVVVTSKNKKKTVWRRCDCCRQPYPTKSNNWKVQPYTQNLKVFRFGDSCLFCITSHPKSGISRA